jgi:1-acyl-sn-glycerol-3-phosphate acyltransferase
MKGVFKFLGMFSVILGFIVHHEIIRLLIWNEDKRLKYFLKSISLHCKVALWFLDIKVSFPNGRKPIEGKLIVSNHVSYVDALILFAYYPSLFVTSVEVRETFLLGRVTYLAGCFFVERRKSRRSQGTVASEIAAMREKLSQHYNICFFPEGTSSNGQSVLPFKTVFFQTAIDCNKPVQPLCLKYTHISGEKFSPKNADYVCWYGAMTFPNHLFKLCQQHSIKVQIIELPEITPAQAPERHQMGALAHQLILESYLS